jgi:hypothetical protein
VKALFNREFLRGFFTSWNGRVTTLGLVGGAIGWMLDANYLSLAVWLFLMLLFPVLSIWPTAYLAVRTFFVVGGLGMGAGLMWGMLFVGLARWLFGLDEETALLWVGLPVLIAFLPFCIFILPKHLRKAGIL